jgi:hypothetical protein
MVYRVKALLNNPQRDSNRECKMAKNTSGKYLQQDYCMKSELLTATTVNITGM